MKFQTLRFVKLSVEEQLQARPAPWLKLNCSGGTLGRFSSFVEDKPFSLSLPRQASFDTGKWR